MNPEEDILALFVTSHGSAQGVALSLGGSHRNVLDEQTLSPTELREALDASGILWRVLIISACQSGVFVTPLQNDNTLIVTAASTDRLSFGCGNGVEFTEFGWHRRPQGKHGDPRLGHDRRRGHDRAGRLERRGSDVRRIGVRGALRPVRRRLR